MAYFVFDPAAPMMQRWRTPMTPIGAMRPTPASAPGRLTGRLGVLLILLTGSLAAPAHALTTISSDTTISSAINDSVQVTGSAQVNLVSGGSISGDLTTYNSSSVTLTGSGAVGGSVTLNDSSTLTLSASGGSIGEGVTVNQSSTLTVLGGTISSPVFDGVYVSGGTVNISGGTISNSGNDGVHVQSGTVNIAGGMISSPASDGVVVNGGTVSISGGTISNTGQSGVYVIGGTASISGGTISNLADPGVLVYSGSVSITGGTISNTGGIGMWVSGGTVSITGGTISNMEEGVVVLGGWVSISGGTISSPSIYGIYVLNGAVDVHGCNLQFDGISLTGTFPDGTPLNTTAFGPLTLDSHEPQITGPANLSRPTDPGLCTATLNPGTATATSPCGLPVQVTGTRSDAQPLNAPYPMGTTTITWTATDASGPLSQGTQTITVTDTEKPSLTCPVNQTVTVTSEAGTPVSYAVQNVTDNCPGVSLVCSPPSGSTFPVGTTTVTCTATDASGNSSACSFTVTVLPLADLAITQSAVLNSGKSGKTIAYTLKVKNNGPTTASSVVVNDPIPIGTVYASATPSPSQPLQTGQGGTATWNLGTLGSGDERTLSLTVTITAKGAVTILNTATVSSSIADPNLVNNSATVQTKIGGR
jgi:uncharacterized repeat protein (TIGR01451 family)